MEINSSFKIPIFVFFTILLDFFMPYSFKNYHINLWFKSLLNFGTRNADIHLSVIKPYQPESAY